MKYEIFMSRAADIRCQMRNACIHALCEALASSKHPIAVQLFIDGRSLSCSFNEGKMLNATECSRMCLAIIASGCLAWDSILEMIRYA